MDKHTHMERSLQLEVGRAITDPQIGTYIYTFMMGRHRGVAFIYIYSWM